MAVRWEGGGEGCQQRPTGLIRIFLSQGDEPHRQVIVLENCRVGGIFQPSEGVETLKGDVESAVELG